MVRILVGDEVGQVKVVTFERKKKDDPLTPVILKLGQVDRSMSIQCITCGPTSDHVFVARACGRVELLDVRHSGPDVVPLFSLGDIFTSTSGATCPSTPEKFIHLSYTQGTLITCTNYGMVSYTPIDVSRIPGMEDTPTRSRKKSTQPATVHTPLPSICMQLGIERAAKEGVLCAMAVHPNLPMYFATGGKELDVCIWDARLLAGNADTPPSPVWKAKNVKNNYLDLRMPVWVSTLQFIPTLSKPNTKQGEADTLPSFELVAGTGYHEIKYYTTASARRPIWTTSIGEHPIRAITLTNDLERIVLSDTTGLMKAVSRSTGKLCGAFHGLAGAVTCLSSGTQKPIVVAVGLDRYLRLFEAGGQHRCMQKVYLKQRLSCVWLDELWVSTSSDTPVQPASKRQRKHNSPTQGEEYNEKGEKKLSDSDSEEEEDEVWAELDRLGVVGN